MPAVYLGDGMILHHLYGRLSSRDVWGGYYQHVTTHVLLIRPARCGCTGCWLKSSAGCTASPSQRLPRPCAPCPPISPASQSTRVIHSEPGYHVWVGRENIGEDDLTMPAGGGEGDTYRPALAGAKKVAFCKQLSGLFLSSWGSNLGSGGTFWCRPASQWCLAA